MEDKPESCLCNCCDRWESANEAERARSAPLLEALDKFMSKFKKAKNDIESLNLRIINIEFSDLVALNDALAEYSKGE